MGDGYLRVMGVSALLYVGEAYPHLDTAAAGTFDAPMNIHPTATVVCPRRGDRKLSVTETSGRFRIAKIMVRRMGGKSKMIEEREK